MQQIYWAASHMEELDRKFLLEVALRMLPDDIATPDDLSAIEDGDRDYRNGETLSDSEINWD
jgi:hypothetical protein